MKTKKQTLNRTIVAVMQSDVHKCRWSPCEDIFPSHVQNLLLCLYTDTCERTEGKQHLSWNKIITMQQKGFGIPLTVASNCLLTASKPMSWGFLRPHWPCEEDSFISQTLSLAIELPDIMDFYNELRSNWQLSGLKGCFWAAVKGFRCETLVFKSTKQNV